MIFELNNLAPPYALHTEIDTEGGWHVPVSLCNNLAVVTETATGPHGTENCRSDLYDDSLIRNSPDASAFFA